MTSLSIGPVAEGLIWTANGRGQQRCPAGVCRALVRYAVDTDVCTGCGACRKTAPGCVIKDDLTPVLADVFKSKKVYPEALAALAPAMKALHESTPTFERS